MGASTWGLSTFSGGKLIPLNQANNAPIILSNAKRVYKLGRNHACDIVFSKEARVSECSTPYPDQIPISTVLRTNWVCSLPLQATRTSFSR